MTESDWAVCTDPPAMLMFLRDCGASEWKLRLAVVSSAHGIYEERAFDRLPLLMDALMDAGCTNEDVLGHCRDSQQAHARGCWVVDLILSRS